MTRPRVVGVGNRVSCAKLELEHAHRKAGGCRGTHKVGYLDLSLVLAFCCGQEGRRAEVEVFVGVSKVVIGVVVQFG
jgi:hypothetical protein